MKNAITSVLIIVMAIALLAPLGHAKTQTAKEVVASLKGAKLGKLAFDEDPLDVVLQYLAEQSGVNFISTDGVNDAEIDVTLALNKGMTVYSVMKILGKLKEIKFYYDAGVIMVLKKDDYSMDEVEVKIYNLDLYRKVNPTDFEAPDIGGGRQQDSGGYHSNEEDEELTAEEIKEMIVKFTGDKSWSLNEKAKIAVKGDNLIINQSAEVHAEILALLEGLAG